MHLNASAARLPVGFAADAAACSLVSGMDGTRVQTLAGDMSVHISCEAFPSALRYGIFEALLGCSADFLSSVRRSATGFGVVSVASDLYYSKLSLGFGSALLSIDARGCVGVIFGDGQAVIDPFEISLLGTRKKRGSGDMLAEVFGSASPAAIRRPTPSSGLLNVNLVGILEPSHITSGGVRYVCLFADAPVTVLPADGGMLRQAFLGSMDLVALSGTGFITTIRPTLAGDAPAEVVLLADFQVIRRAEASSPVVLSAEVEPDCIVQGSGSAPVVVVGVFTGSVLRKGAGSLELACAADLNGARTEPAAGDVVVSCHADLSALRLRMLDAEAVVDALSFASPVINPLADGLDDLTFTKPALERVFVRPAQAREFFR